MSSPLLMILALCVMRSESASWNVLWSAVGTASAASSDPTTPGLSVVYSNSFYGVINTTSGKFLWTEKTAAYTAAIGSGMAFLGIGRNYNGNVESFDVATGQYHWGVSSSNFNGGAMSITLVASAGLLLVESPFAVYALNASNGRTVWVHGEGGGFTNIFGVFNGVLSVKLGDVLYGLDLMNNGKWLWQHNVGYTVTLIPSTTKGVTAFTCGNQFCVNEIDVATGDKTEWAILNSSIWGATVHCDPSTEMVVLVCQGYPVNSIVIFNGTSGKQVKHFPNATTALEVVSCLASHCITLKYMENAVQLTATNYMSWTLAWNVTVPVTSSYSLAFTLLRPDLIFISAASWTEVDNPASVIGITPASGKFWTQSFGTNAVFLLQQLSNTELFLGSKNLVALVNV